MKVKALRAAFPYTLPIFMGFLFLGIAYGVYMGSKGFSFVYPMLMSLTILAGSMEFVAVNLLMRAFDPVTVFLLTLMVNARHLFYGISMLERYKDTGKKKCYLIFGMCDESFSINAGVKPPDGVDRGWFMFFVTALNHAYWFIGSTLGGILGNLVSFESRGWISSDGALRCHLSGSLAEKKQHLPALVGLTASVLSLVVFGPDGFIVPAMLLIVASLSALMKKLYKEETAV
jgi:4-azaleucine resistance transporter AzlC